MATTRHILKVLLLLLIKSGFTVTDRYPLQDHAGKETHFIITKLNANFKSSQFKDSNRPIWFSETMSSNKAKFQENQTKVLSPVIRKYNDALKKGQTPNITSFQFTKAFQNNQTKSNSDYRKSSSTGIIENTLNVQQRNPIAIIQNITLKQISSTENSPGNRTHPIANMKGMTFNAQKSFPTSSVQKMLQIEVSSSENRLRYGNSKTSVAGTNETKLNTKQINQIPAIQNMTVKEYSFTENSPQYGMSKNSFNLTLNTPAIENNYLAKSITSEESTYETTTPTEHINRKDFEEKHHIIIRDIESLEEVNLRKTADTFDTSLTTPAIQKSHSTKENVKDTFAITTQERLRKEALHHEKYIPTYELRPPYKEYKLVTTTTHKIFILEEEPEEPKEDINIEDLGVSVREVNRIPYTKSFQEMVGAINETNATNSFIPTLATLAMKNEHSTKEPVNRLNVDIYQYINALNALNYKEVNDTVAADSLNTLATSTIGKKDLTKATTSQATPTVKHTHTPIPFEQINTHTAIPFEQVNTHTEYEDNVTTSETRGIENKDSTVKKQDNYTINPLHWSTKISTPLLVPNEKNMTSEYVYTTTNVYHSTTYSTNYDKSERGMSMFTQDIQTKNANSVSQMSEESEFSTLTSTIVPNFKTVFGETLIYSNFSNEVKDVKPLESTKEDSEVTLKEELVTLTAELLSLENESVSTLQERQDTMISDTVTSKKYISVPSSTIPIFLSDLTENTDGHSVNKTDDLIKDELCFNKSSLMNVESLKVTLSHCVTSYAGIQSTVSCDYRFNYTLNNVSDSNVETIAERLKTASRNIQLILMLAKKEILTNSCCIENGTDDKEGLYIPWICVYISAGLCLTIFISAICTALCCSKCKNYSPSGNLDKIPHLNINVADYRMDRIPRPSISYSASNGYRQAFINDAYNFENGNEARRGSNTNRESNSYEMIDLGLATPANTNSFAGATSSSRKSDRKSLSLTKEQANSGSFGLLNGSPPDKKYSFENPNCRKW